MEKIDLVKFLTAYKYMFTRRAPTKNNERTVAATENGNVHNF